METGGRVMETKDMGDLGAKRGGYLTPWMSCGRGGATCHRAEPPTLRGWSPRGSLGDSPPRLVYVISIALHVWVGGLGSGLLVIASAGAGTAGLEGRGGNGDECMNVDSLRDMCFVQ